MRLPTSTLQVFNLKDDPTTPQLAREDIDSFLAKMNLPSFSKSHLQTLNATVFSEELEHTIVSLPIDKALGPDGLSNAYYKKIYIS